MVAKDNVLMDEHPLISDPWLRWLLQERDGGDSLQRERVAVAVNKFRDRVLDNARLQAGQILLDIGSGEGLLGLGAIERVGPSLRVIFNDVSATLLSHLREIALSAGVAGQCTYLHTSAERLDGIGTGSVDVVASRAAIAYVAEKSKAFAEFYRVIRPGGRISLAEPINQDQAFELAGLTDFLRANPRHPQAKMMELRRRIKAAQYPSTPEDIARDPLTNFSERDLVGFLRAAGFVHVHLELHIDVQPVTVSTWKAYLNTSPRPTAATPAQVMSRQFSSEERALFESVMRPIIESGQSLSTDMVAYATAEKPVNEAAHLLR